MILVVTLSPKKLLEIYFIRKEKEYTRILLSNFCCHLLFRSINLFLRTTPLQLKTYLTLLEFMLSFLVDGSMKCSVTLGVQKFAQI